MIDDRGDTVGFSWPTSLVELWLRASGATNLAAESWARIRSNLITGRAWYDSEEYAKISSYGYMINHDWDGLHKDDEMSTMSFHNEDLRGQFWIGVHTLYKQQELSSGQTSKVSYRSIQ